MLDFVRIVLVHTSHPGNIGAAARAMKNMGLSRLYLVAPQEFPHKEATIRASGADDILEQAIITPDLKSALKDCELIYGTSARTRELPWPTCNARECAEQIITSQPRETAIVFGRESSGLTNDELTLCHFHVHIPTAPHFSSLNLAAAVQILAYELHMNHTLTQPNVLQPQAPLATHEQMSGFFEQLRITLVKLDFLDPSQPKKLMQRLHRLFNRAQPDPTEINILRGILTAMNKRL